MLEETGWEPPALALWSGVGKSTILAWLAGDHKPMRPEWERVAATLALERCTACNGAGHRNPGIPPELLAIDRIEQQRLQEQRYRQRKREQSA